MKRRKYEIEPGEASPRVTLLQKSLAALGVAVDPDEFESSTFGQDTETKLREIQGHVGLNLEDRPLLDAATQHAIEAKLKESGLAENKHSFTVAGTITDVSGRPVSNLQVLAYDVDLRGVHAQRDAGTVDKLERANGFDVLGEDVTDHRGAYSITFYDWQFGKAERGTANVLAFGVDDEKRIVARSRMVRSEDYVDDSFVRDLDLVAVAREEDRTEYGHLRSLLDPCLSESEVRLESLARVDEEIAFTARELNVEAAQVGAVADATAFVRTLSDYEARGQQGVAGGGGHEKPSYGDDDVELTYGLVRQGIPLKWSAIARRSAGELMAAVKDAAEAGTIAMLDDQKIDVFIKNLRSAAAGNALDEKTPDGATVDEMLAPVLPEAELRDAYAQAVVTFEGAGPAEFWTQHLPAQEAFQDRPEIVAGVEVAMTLNAITGGHLPLVEALAVDRKVRSVDDLLALSPDVWREAVAQAGVPGQPEAGEQEQEQFAEFLAGTINAAYPTKRVALLVSEHHVSIADEQVAAGVSAVLSESSFDIATSRVADVEDLIRAHAAERTPEVASELKTLQRIFQVSTSPSVMAALYERGLDSAHSIVSIPRKSFVATYGDALGGLETALAVHQRAAHVAGRAEMAAGKLMEVLRPDVPLTVLGAEEQSAAGEFLSGALPSYTQLFGGLSICECHHCNSLFSPSAYMVELLRFLSRGEPNDDGATPLDILNRRRPDIIHLPLTCENATTILPYVDLANEIMERYTVSGSLNGFSGYDTGDATETELRAHPQHSDTEAYRRLSQAVRPFTLPYHQPLDVIRSHSDQLGTSRYDVMRALHPEPEAERARAIAAEALHCSPKEYALLTGETFDGTAAAVPLHEAYGYASAGDLENLRAVLELMARAGVSYLQLVDLVKTHFVNPHLQTLDFLEGILRTASVPPDIFYGKLQEIAAGNLDPASDADVMATLGAYNDGRRTTLTPEHLGSWLEGHFNYFREVVTLYEPESRCDLETTELRTMGQIYEGSETSGVAQDTWGRLHLFVRLWRLLGLSIHEVDLLLTALGQDDIGPETIDRLEHALALRDAARVPVTDIGVLWGLIDVGGQDSLYRRLFLNRAVQRIDDAFLPDAEGRYLTDEDEPLGDHRPALLAAFKLRASDLEAILSVARVVEDGALREIDPLTDPLTLPFLSTIYRYEVLARVLRIKVADLCTLIKVLDAPPFSVWDVDIIGWTAIDPGITREFYDRVSTHKEFALTAPVLAYAVTGERSPDGRLGLDEERIHATVRGVRASLLTIEQSHPSAPSSPMTASDLAARLALTFQPPVVTRLLTILDGTAIFEAFAHANLDVTIPEPLEERFTYIEASGRLTARGVMTNADRTALKALGNTDASFDAAVDNVYEDPEIFLTREFGNVFANTAEALEILLGRSPQVPPTTLEQRLLYVYIHLVPLMKAELRRRMLTQHLGELLGTDDATTSVLIGDDAQHLLEELSAEGWTARYFSDPGWSTEKFTRIEPTVDFDWANQPPDPEIPADGFSAVWDAFVLAPAAGERTLVVQVAGDDDVFTLTVDGTEVLEKAGGDTGRSLEVLSDLDGGRFHRLRLDYADITGTSGVSLLWKTATSGLEVLPPQDVYPVATIEKFADAARELHRGATLIVRLGLGPEELTYIVEHSADFGDVDFRALTPEHVERLVAYARLRNAVPEGKARLIDVFTAASATHAPTLDGLLALVRDATGWDEPSLGHLATIYAGLAVGDFTDEVALERLRGVMEILARTGVSAQTVIEWGAVTDDFDTLHATTQVLKRAVAAVYDEEEALEIAGQLSDVVRTHQRDALVEYLLTRPEIHGWGATDADGLYEYLLIDVQMGSCMDTSRVVQASAAVQQFVQRCLLNLESVSVEGREIGVAPGAIDRERWEWMKQYRVWEANRKVFLYPENWLEPEWRMDRSEFFRDLESYLLQNDVTDGTVEQALRAYLTSLDGVANLDVCGTHRENHIGGSLKFLHVFARTHTAPYAYYHRTWDQFGKWSPWSSVPVDIRATEDVGTQQGGNNGVCLMPVLWKQRLFLFWPEFLRVSDPPAKGSSSAEDVSDDKMSTLQAVEKTQIRLAWSEFVDGRWAPKAVTKEFVEQWSHWQTEVVERDYLLTPSIDPTTQELTITLSNTHFNQSCGRFKLSDITSPVYIQHSVNYRWPLTSLYRYEFGKRRGSGKLELENDTYLREPIEHALLPVDTQKGLEVTLDDPFFYIDRLRTYFVRPVPIEISLWALEPPLWVDIRDAVLQPPFLIPDLEDLRLTGELFKELEDVGVQLEPQHGITVGPQPSFGPKDALDVAKGLVPRSMVRADNGGAPTMAARNLAMTASFTQTQVIGSGMVGSAFGSIVRPGRWRRRFIRYDRGLEFHTFHHPYTGEYIKRLNQGGVPALMASNLILGSDQGATFESAYDPVFADGFVQRPVDFSSRTYYQQNVCFDPLGSNSSYNMELFFHVPLYIATRLSKNGRHEEAMKWFHLIFDPTTDVPSVPGESATARYWKLLPFRKTVVGDLEEWFRTLGPNTDSEIENAVIAEWRDHPFDPHRVAVNRPIAYMKHVVIRYVENLVEWADSLFRRFTRESVFEALQLYVMASHVLGKRPEFVPRRGRVDAESYASLETSWDDFSNALVELENVFPYSSDAPVSDSTLGNALLGVGSALYFCVPPNEALLEHWDRVENRLYKIRHCQDIDGVERQLALFAPPIDPAALMQATAQGLSIGSILADLGSPPPIYRFGYLLQRANEFCNEVRGLGQSLLTAFEKRDAEELARLRTVQERDLLQRVTEVRQRQVLEAMANRENLLKARDAVAGRLQHYVELLGETITVPAPPTISVTLNEDSQLPTDTSIAQIATGADTALTDSGETGVKVIDKEKAELDLNLAAQWVRVGASGLEVLAGVAALFPQIDAEGTPLGVGAGAWWGGQNLSAAGSAAARAAEGVSAFLSSEAAQAATVASYIRREQEWAFQANSAAREIVQLDKQLTSADIQIQVVTKELESHRLQIEQANQIEEFLKDKFTGQELYQWMRERLLVVYKQSYTLAYELAKKCENAMRNELGDDTASFVNYGYWDNSKQGLMAGEELQLALRRMENAYLNDNRRDLELTKSISLLRLDPLALLALRETGRCTVSIPEELFDLDFPGHYFRRIKAVRLSIPCIAGPHTTVSCTLRLLDNTVRVNTSMNSSGEYEHEHDEGVWIDDDRFRVKSTPVRAIATSTAQSDPGLFELSFRDERYLPFEYAGAISKWAIELTQAEELRQFDHGTIADVVLHLSYTARETGGTFRRRAADHVKDFVANASERPNEPIAQMFSARADFPSQWRAFFRPAVEGDDQVLRLTIGTQRLLFLARGRNIVISRLEFFAHSTHAGDYSAMVSTVNHDGDTVESDEFPMGLDATYGGLHRATLDATDAGLNLEEVNVEAEMTLKMKRHGTADYASLVADPEEIENVYVVIHYRLR